MLKYKILGAFTVIIKLLSRPVHEIMVLIVGHCQILNVHASLHTCAHLAELLQLTYTKYGCRYECKVKMGLVARKLVFRVSDKASFKPVSSATDTS